MQGSFVDRIVHWATDRGIHWWVLIGIWVVVLVGVNVGVALGDGTAGDHFFHSRETFYGVYGIFVYAYLNGRAGHALDRFRPALAANDEQAAALRRNLTTLPPRMAIGALIIGAAFGALYAANDPIVIEIAEVSAIGGLLVGLFGWVVNLAIAGLFLTQIVRILVWVTRLHRRADRIELFDPGPAHAFAGVTAAAGALVIVVVTYSALSDPATFRDPFALVLIVALMVVAVLVFTLPLVGIRRRLVSQRDALLLDSSKRIRRLGAVVGTAVDEGRYETAGQLKDALDALELDRENIARKSTWPWEGATLSRFGAALLLPLLTWLITNVLGRLLGL
jgi:hypothetical protein